MAQLDLGGAGANHYRSVSVVVQMRAIAWLRWHLFVNTFVRALDKQSVAGLLLLTLLRLLIWTIFAAATVGPVIASGWLAWKAVASHHPRMLPLLLAGIFVFWQFVNLNGLNLAASTSSFDPASLARFPIPFGRYLVLRTVFGLLTVSTTLGCLMLLAVAIGMRIANHALALPALTVLTVYAWTIIFFTRMLGAWFERWFAIRRFRGMFGVIMMLVLVGPQLLNLRHHTLNAGDAHSFVNLLRTTSGLLRWYPPGLAVHAIYFRGHVGSSLLGLAVLLGWMALFLGAFAFRLHKQFLGEYLSESSSSAKTGRSALRLKQRSLHSPKHSTMPKRAGTLLCPVLIACVRKEFAEFIGSGSQLLSMLTPLLLVLILSHGVLAQHPRFLLPGALGYVLIGFLPRLYNIFGADGSGVQIYLLAPVRLRDVIVAKNIVSLIPTVVEACLAWTLVMLLRTSPIAPSIQIASGLWLVFLIATNLAFGTLRSVQAPHKFGPGKAAKQNATTGRSSGLLTTTILLGSFVLYVPLEFGARYLGQPWLPAMTFAVLAAGALLAYAFLLRHADQLVLSHRERLAEELCRE